MSELAIEDAQLVGRAQDGDLDAFQALYERYFARIFDFCYQMVRNRDDAADLTSDVFLKAIERLAGLRDPEAFRGWLYAIARNAALNLIERRSRTTTMPEGHEPPAPADGVTAPLTPHDAVERAELRELVWEAAATLDARDYSIFEMLVRQGLGSGEVAEALGLKPSHAYVLISRMKDTVSDALGAVVLARVGRRDCAELDAVVARFGDERSPKMRKAVGRHLRHCDGCRTRRARYVSPAALMSGVAFAAAPAGLKEELGVELVAAWQACGPGSGGRPPRPRGPGRGRRRISRLGAGVLLLLVTAGVLRADAPLVVPEAAGETESVAALATPRPPTPAPAVSETNPQPDPELESAPGGTPVPAAPASTPIPRSTPAPTPPPAPPTVATVSVSPGVIYDADCGARTATVSATVDAPAGVSSVVLTRTKDGSTTTSPMSGGPTTYQATAGPYDTAGAVGMLVTVTDAEGRQASATASLSVEACRPQEPDPTPTPTPVVRESDPDRSDGSTQ